MPLSICELFEWYLVVTCKRCGLRQPLHRDTSKGKSTLLLSYEWRCIHCGRVATYKPSEIERYQHGVEPTNETATLNDFSYTNMVCRKISDKNVVCEVEIIRV